MKKIFVLALTILLPALAFAQKQNPQTEKKVVAMFTSIDQAVKSAHERNLLQYRSSPQSGYEKAFGAQGHLLATEDGPAMMLPAPTGPMPSLKELQKEADQELNKKVNLVLGTDGQAQAYVIELPALKGRKVALLAEANGTLSYDYVKYENRLQFRADDDGKVYLVVTPKATAEELLGKVTLTFEVVPGIQELRLKMRVTVLTQENFASTNGKGEEMMSLDVGRAVVRSR